jgi:S1-C subfamily serine protease
MKRIRVILISLVVLTLFASPLLAKAYMGVYLGDLSRKDYEKFGLKENYGILIKKVVDESPADNAGLKGKDIILELAGDKVYTTDQLTKMLSYFEPEQKVKIKYFRDNKVKTLNLKLGEKKTFRPKKKAYLGVFLAELDNEIREKLELKEQHGILITKTVEDGPSEKAGIKNKTVFLEMDGEKIYTIDQLTKMLSSYKPEQEVKLYIYYKKDYKNVTVKLGEREDLMFKFGDVFDWNFLNRPDNVFVYQYDMENRKWIGAILKTNEKIVRDGDEETIEINITVDNVIEDTPADKAGLKEGDKILAVDGKEIKSSKQMGKIINSKEAGDNIELKIMRNGEKKTITCEIAKRKDYEGYEKVEVSVDDGDIRIWMNGEEKSILDMKKLSEEMYKLKALQKADIKEEMKKVQEEMEKVRRELNNITIEIEKEEEI